MHAILQSHEGWDAIESSCTDDQTGDDSQQQNQKQAVKEACENEKSQAAASPSRLSAPRHPPPSGRTTSLRCLPAPDHDKPVNVYFQQLLLSTAQHNV